MSESNHLSLDEREFFGLVSQAAFINPFSETRIELDLKIGESPRNVLSRTRIERAVKKLRDRVARLEKEGRADINIYSGEERMMMQSAFLFDVFHRFSPKFADLIVTQILEGDSPCPVPFAEDILSILVKLGFATEEAHRLFAMIYQLKRAYYFIDEGLIGQSPSMKQFRLRLWNNVFTHDIRWYDRYLWDRMEDFSTLILGETGSGKGTAAAAIGRSGFIPYDGKKGCFKESFSRNFISINLSLYSESLIESELFGHKKGAFTGAIEHHQGIFSRCSPHGAIFLDEIGDVSIPVQVKLLQVLQERTFSPVGGHERLRFNGRVIAATNKPLDFRDDFYYRLCSDCIVVPSLRQRIQEDRKELDLILAHVINRLIGEESKDLEKMVKNVIADNLGPDYNWPGNVRELEQAVRRILLTRKYESDQTVTRSEFHTLLNGIETGSLSAQEVLCAYCSLLYQKLGTYEAVARKTNLDRRTVKRYIEMQKKRNQG
jgi:DNA-binding NtrC family response regulator